MTATTKTDRKQFLSDVFTIALEGGIDYWAVVTQYHHSEEDKEDLDFYAIVSDCCEGDETFPDSRIDKNIIRKGINEIINNKNLKISETIRARIKEASRFNNAGLIDAGDADCIIQVGLFGELVFG